VEIGKTSKPVRVEPLENPVPQRQPVPKRRVTPTPKRAPMKTPDREKVK
jgi:hypothetical protein